jgi:hypothetical protein
VEATESYLDAFPAAVLGRYDFAETRNAARILAATNPEQFDDLVAVLEGFSVDVGPDLLARGGNESDTAARLNHGFRDRGWCEGSYAVTIRGEFVLRAPGGRIVVPSEQAAASYNIDNVKGRVALDVEWHAKDGNLDRDLAAYRSLYDSGIIDCAVMVTMTRESMRAWAGRLDPSSTKFNTTTTTNLEKLRPRLTRGDSGGCPVLVVSVCDRTV